MADYTQTTDFSEKDNLQSGDPLKIIRGQDVDVELDAIKTAIASKLDTTSAVTMTDIYPVNSIFISTNSNSPDTYMTGLGLTTWTAFGAGRVLVGYDSGDTAFDTVEETGGAKTHTLSNSEMPYHRHSLGLSKSDNTYGDGSSNGTKVGSYSPLYSGYEGGSGGVTQPHNNLQPYIVVYMWKRTA